MRVLLERLRTHSIQKEKPKIVPQRTNAYVEQKVNSSTFLDPEAAGWWGACSVQHLQMHQIIQCSERGIHGHMLLRLISSEKRKTEK
jgi:hypothetical protein